MGIGNLGSLDDLFHRGILHTECDIIIEGVVEEDSLLVDVAYQRTQLRDTYRLDILAVDEHLTLVDIMVTGNQGHQCRFTRTRLSHQCDGLPFGHLQIDVLQYLTPLDIAERYVAQLDILLERWHRLGLCRFLDGVVGLEDKVDTVHGCQSDRYLIGGLRQFLDRIDDTIQDDHVEDER